MPVLDDIRVLDFGRFIAAPYAAMVLADMGAEVIRVERPGGEEDRTWGLRAANGENLSFPSYARNKLGVTLDLRKPEACELLHDLVRGSDVVIHNYSPPAMRAFGLTYEELREVKPDLIYTSVSCYGTVGPYTDRVGFDPIAQSISGAAAFQGFADDPPSRSQLPWVDYSTGLAAALGTVLALRHRDKTGEGQSVDLVLLRTALSFTAPMIAEARILGRERPKIGNRTAYVGPSDMFKCRDGWVYVSVIMDGMWRRLMETVGHAEFARDPDFDSDLQRFENRDRVDHLVAEWMERHTVAEVMEAMDVARIPCGQALQTSEVPDDPHVQAAGMLPLVDLDAPGLERVPTSAEPIRLSTDPPPELRRAPRVGEHNARVYGALPGYDAARIAELRSRGVI